MDSSRLIPLIETTEDESVVSLKDALHIAQRRAWVILLSVIVVVGLAMGVNLMQMPQYEASVRILIGQESGIADDPANVQGLRDLTLTMTAAVDTRPVAEGVIQRLDLNTSPDKLLDNLSAEQVPDTQFIQVSYRDPDPQTAGSVANAVGEVFSDRIANISPDAGAVTATVWEQAAVPEEPASPNILRNVLLALMLGALIGIGLAALLEYLDDSWRSLEEAEQVTGVPTLGVIPRFEAPRGSKKTKKPGRSILRRFAFLAKPDAANSGRKSRP